MRFGNLGILFPLLYNCLFYGSETIHDSSFVHDISKTSSLIFSPFSLAIYAGSDPTHSPTLPQGSRYDITRDVIISEYRESYRVNSYYSSLSGGGLACRNINISNNVGDIFFEQNASADMGGAIYAAQACIVSNNRNYTFARNYTQKNVSNPSNTCSGGAIYADGCTISNNLGKGNFSNNLALSKGGAIYTTNNLTILNNTKAILINSNQCNAAKSLGGAVYTAGSMIVSGNKQPIVILNNTAGQGGAIFAEENLVISDNEEIIEFANNTAFGNVWEVGWNPGGGAIMSLSCILENNRRGLIFDNNHSYRNGGVFNCKQLTIQGNGPVYFTNNLARWGGAIINQPTREDSTSKFVFFADYGDIIFNYNFTANGTLASYRNAIHTTPNVNLQIGARAGYSVILYDPIEHVHPTRETWLFNPEPHHQGTVLFSGKTVDLNLTTDLNLTADKNYFTYSGNRSELHHGVLAVEDKAGLVLYQFSQMGGTVRLGNGAVISTMGRMIAEVPNPTSETWSTIGSVLTLNNIAINLPSILAKNAQPPKIWIYPTRSGAKLSPTYIEDNHPSITVSGPLTVTNSDNTSPYDSLDLSQPLHQVPLLYILDVTAKHIDTSELDITALNMGQHYGYQGLWSPYWMETTTTTNPTSPLSVNTQHRVLYADWTPITYFPDPMRRGELVVNTLWQSAYTTLAGMRILSPESAQYTVATSGHGLRLFVHQQSSGDVQGFHSQATGYAVTSAATTAAHNKVSLGFAQFFSKMKEYTTKNTVSSHSYFASMQLESSLWNEIEVSCSLAYTHGSHQLSSNYITLKESSQGAFHSHTLGAAFSCTFLPTAITKSLHLTPFARAVVIHATQAMFKEVGDGERVFAMQHPLRNVLLPVGARFYLESSSTHLPMRWEVEAAYLPSVYRQNPKIQTTLLVSGGSWSTPAASVARHGFALRVKHTADLFLNVSIALDYSGEASTSTLSHDLQGKWRLKF
ncbi:polymorphic outer membrane protein middle domain-containing protein [Candidatus Chlamydia sanziniae]|uniref:Outer membrane protein 5 n=1 Tax=Candidatus Chlamydia sanziniae TaxID=1806891 RepID=A0A1A9HWF7_9CHLA|nr:polymorphic outer membrane protein middle domain-containing protein [Candidatus Chlamydia sanziniae]ANH78256.1 outer membrane protein 5 [Candidatus Chlamydia sanziniae]